MKDLENSENLLIIDEFGISFAHASVRGHSTKQAFSAAELAREEYFFFGPSQGMFLLIPCLSLMTSEYPMVHCSLRDAELAYWPKTG